MTSDCTCQDEWVMSTVAKLSAAPAEPHALGRAKQWYSWALLQITASARAAAPLEVSASTVAAPLVSVRRLRAAAMGPANGEPDTRTRWSSASSYHWSCCRAALADHRDHR